MLLVSISFPSLKLQQEQDACAAFGTNPSCVMIQEANLKENQFSNFCLSLSRKFLEPKPSLSQKYSKSEACMAVTALGFMILDDGNQSKVRNPSFPSFRMQS
jgi:hypothetical protein